MRSVNHGDRHTAALGCVHVVYALGLARDHNEPGFALVEYHLAMDRHVADAGLGVFYDRHAGREVATAVLFRGHHGRDIEDIDVVALEDDFLNRGRT